MNQVCKACSSNLMPALLPAMCRQITCGGGPVLIVSISLQIKYKKNALDNYPNFTSVVDPPEIVLAKINSVNQSDVSLLCAG